MDTKRDAEGDIPSMDLPWDPNTRHVNWEVLKRLSFPKFYKNAELYKAFADDAPYKRYIEAGAGDHMDSELEALSRVTATVPALPESTGNRFEVSRAVSPGWDWRNLGRVFDNSAKPQQTVLALSTSLVADAAQKKVEQGKLVSKALTIGNISSLGFSHRHRRWAFNLTAKHSTIAQPGRPGGSAPGLKAQLGFEQSEDTYITASYDFADRVPELGVAWSGETSTQKAFLYAAVSPGSKTPAHIRGAVSFPGPEWRPMVWDGRSAAGPVPPADHGARHQLWLEHGFGQEGRSQVGAILDLNFAANLTAYFWRNVLEGSVAPWTRRLWNVVPFGRTLRKTLLPYPSGDDVLSFRFQGWKVGASHDFNSKQVVEDVTLTCPVAGGSLNISKHLGTQHIQLGWQRGALSVDALVSDTKLERPHSLKFNLDLFAMR